MKILIPLALLVLVLMIYAVFGRDWLKKQESARGFFAWVEPVEIFLFKKSETILFARTLQVLGGVLSALTWLGSIDITPLLPLFPEHADMARTLFGMLPLVLNVLGAIVERLRNTTTKPLELVAVPDKVVADSPRLQEAVAMADATKAEAVAVTAIEQAKAA